MVAAFQRIVSEKYYSDKTINTSICLQLLFSINYFRLGVACNVFAHYLASSRWSHMQLMWHRTGWWQCAAPFPDHLSAVETDRMQFPESGKPGVGAMHIKGSQKISETWVLPVLYTSHHLCFSSLAGQMVGHRNMKTFTSYAKNRRVSIRDRPPYEKVCVD